MSRASTILETRDVSFAWKGQPDLRFPDIRLLRGQSLFIHGPSGCGKSTALGLLAGVLSPKTGTIHIGDKPLPAGQSGRDRVRADGVGYIFQQFNLLPYLSVADNVKLPCRLSRRRRSAAMQTGNLDGEVDRLLAALGLEPTSLRGRVVSQLSVGQQQRVAAARALIGSPGLLLADEPTSALDADARDAFIRLLQGECAMRGISTVFVSHDLSLARHFDDAVRLGS